MDSHFPLAAFLLALLAGSAKANDCPVTLPSSSPVDLTAFHGTGWYGSEALAVRLPLDGQWIGMGPNRNYGDKLWFWRKGYEATEETKPDLVLRGKQLRPAKHTLHIDQATNAMGKGRSAMLVGMEFPSAGCWEVTATYRYGDNIEHLTFVVDVGRDPARILFESRCQSRRSTPVSVSTTTADSAVPAST